MTLYISVAPVWLLFSSSSPLLDINLGFSVYTTETPNKNKRRESVDMAHGASSSSDVNCSICWDGVSESCGRTVVRLLCSHLFHLDCIGSAFNASGVMQCPNCRVIENGVWKRFEDYTSEGSVDQEDDQESIEMESIEDLLCPFHEGVELLALPSFGSQDIAEQHVSFPSNPDINRWYGQSELTPISAAHAIHGHYDNWVQPSMFTSISHHIAGTNQASVQSATLRVAHNDPGGMPNLESVGQRVILQHGNEPVYNNFQWMQPLSNSLSPAVRASMLSGRSGSNGLAGGLPAGHAISLAEQATSFYPVPSLSISTPNHQQAAFLVHHHVQERDPFAPFEHLPDDMGRYWGRFN